MPWKVSSTSCSWPKWPIPPPALRRCKRLLNKGRSPCHGGPGSSFPSRGTPKLVRRSPCCLESPGYEPLCVPGRGSEVEFSSSGAHRSGCSRLGFPPRILRLLPCLWRTRPGAQRRHQRRCGQVHDIAVSPGPVARTPRQRPGSTAAESSRGGGKMRIRSMPAVSGSDPLGNTKHMTAGGVLAAPFATLLVVLGPSRQGSWRSWRRYTKGESFDRISGGHGGLESVTASDSSLGSSVGSSAGIVRLARIPDVRFRYSGASHSRNL